MRMATGRGRGDWGGEWRAMGHAMRHAARRGFGPFEVEWSFAPRGGGGRGGRRMFDGSELRLVLLKLIEEAPRHGYELIREIEARTGGAYAPSPGVVYPTLTMLAEMDLIAEQASDGARKSFAITNAGQAHLTEHEARVEAVMARLVQLGEAHAHARGGPVRRAMGNLKAVLQERLASGGGDADARHRIAAIIDEAAQRIERLA